MANDLNALIEAEVARQIKVSDRIAELEAENAALKAAAHAEVTRATRAPRDAVAPANLERNATKRQRGMIMGLTGHYPSESTGFDAVTREQASAAINALLQGESAEVGGYILEPLAE